MATLTSKENWVITEKTPVKMMRELMEKDYENPFYILDVGDIIHKVENWRKLMPRVEIFYAVKCNDHQSVLDTLVTLGTGFDCASKVEIQKVLTAGAKVHDIIYAHPCKAPSHIKYASDVELSLMTFDSKEELYKIKKIYPEANLVLRIRCDSSSAMYSLGQKFGVDVKEATSLLRVASDLDLNVVGVSFHIGSGCKEPAAYNRAISLAKDVFEEALNFGMDPYILDIGGGFSGHLCDLQEFASVINSALDIYFHNESIKIIAEPGRYIVTSAFTLATRVIAKKEKWEENKLQMSYYINDGIYGSFSSCLYEEEPFKPKALKTIIIEEEDINYNEDKETEETILSTIWGPTCCGFDLLRRAVRMPRLECGDWIQWENMGAYTLSLACGFNGFNIPDVYVIIPSVHRQASKGTETWAKTWIQKRELESPLLKHATRRTVSKLGPL